MHCATPECYSDQRRGEWEPSIFFRNIFDHCPKSPPNTSKLSKLNYSSQLVTRALRQNPHTGRKAITKDGTQNRDRTRKIWKKKELALGKAGLARMEGRLGRVASLLCLNLA
jgi:hypothetical protein